MASFTFGSFGDIITLCGMVNQAVVSLSDSCGAVAQFHDLLNEISSLSTALSSSKLLLEQNPSLREHSGLQSVLSDCSRCLETFLNKMKSFEILGQDKGKAHLMKTYKKLRWPAQKVSLRLFWKFLPSASH